MTFDPNKIPKWLRRTPEQQEQDRALQQRLKEASGPGIRPTATEQHLLRARAIRISAQAHLDHLRKIRNPNPQHIVGAEAQLAEALAMQGDYAEAADLHPHPEHAARFRAIAEAIDRDDDAPVCNCEMEKKHEATQNREVFLPNQIISEMVFSPKHRKLMPLVKCVKCGDLNVKAAPADMSARLHRIAEEHRKAKGARANGT